MKPCSRNRKLIAWLALGALDAHQERDLRAHLDRCEGCRGHLQEISNVAEKLAASEISSELRASESFHQRVVRAVAAEETGSARERVMALFRAKARFLTDALASNEGKIWGSRGPGFARRLALPLIGATAVVVAAWLAFKPGPGNPSPAPTVVQPLAAVNAPAELEPTISNYQRVANRSLENLDLLLTKQGNMNPPPTPIYTASAIARANALD